MYKALVKNAGAYREWAGWYKWARSLVERQEFTVAAGDIKRLRGAQRRLEVAEEVRRELNSVLALYSQSGFYKEADLKKLKSLLEVDLGMAEELAEARRVELSRYSNANMGTKVYAALLSVARGGMYGHAATLLMGEGLWRMLCYRRREAPTRRPRMSPRSVASPSTRPARLRGR